MIFEKFGDRTTLGKNFIDETPKRHFLVRNHVVWSISVESDWRVPEEGHDKKSKKKRKNGKQPATLPYWADQFLRASVMKVG
jgi:hypothetical protein